MYYVIFLLEFGTLIFVHMMYIFLSWWWLYSTTDIIIILWAIIYIRNVSCHLFIFGVFEFRKCMTGNVDIVVEIDKMKGYAFKVSMHQQMLTFELNYREPHLNLKF